MNCRAIEPLLLTERDGVLTTDQRASLDRHVATCLACQPLRARVSQAMSAFQADAASIVIPDIEEEWRTLRAQLHGASAKPVKKRPLAPVIWFSASLAAAAALTLAYLGLQPTNLPTVTPIMETAGADYVEAGDASASTMVYVDKDSGWLVVWATDDANRSG